MAKTKGEGSLDGQHWTVKNHSLSLFNSQEDMNPSFHDSEQRGKYQMRIPPNFSAHAALLSKLFTESKNRTALWLPFCVPGAAQLCPSVA